MKKVFWVAIVSMIFIVLTGCSEGAKVVPDESVKKKKEKLVVYTPTETDHLQDHLALFEKEHPDITLEIIRDSSGIVTSRLLAEKNNPKADVIWGLGVESLIMFDEENMLAGYTPQGAENLLPQFADQKNEPMKWTGVSGYMTAISVNTAEMEKLGLPIPKSYEDLTDPQYKGLISMPNPASSGTGFLTVAGLLQLFASEEEGWEYLDKLHGNMGVYTHSGSKPAVEAAVGEFPIGISFDGRSIKQEESGAPLVTVFPEEGSGWTIEANALIEKETIKEEAKLFLDWAISRTAMESYGKYFALTGIDLGSPPPVGYPEKLTEQLIDNDLYWAAEHRQEIVDKWIEKYDTKSEAKE